MGFRLATIAFICTSCSVGTAAEWTNPSERYSQAYEAYLDLQCPIQTNAIKHFVYLARDRERLRHHVRIRAEISSLHRPAS